MLNPPSLQNNTTNVVIQQNSRKLLMIDILMSETCWARKKWNKIASDIKLVSYSSTIITFCLAIYERLYIYIYIYIYMCVCVCVCVCARARVFYACTYFRQLLRNRTQTVSWPFPAFFTFLCQKFPLENSSTECISLFYYTLYLF